MLLPELGTLEEKVMDSQEGGLGGVRRGGEEAAEGVAGGRLLLGESKTLASTSTPRGTSDGEVEESKRSPSTRTDDDAATNNNKSNSKSNISSSTSRGARLSPQSDNDCNMAAGSVAPNSGGSMTEEDQKQDGHKGKRDGKEEEIEFVIEQPLLTVKEVFVYRVPPLRASSGHRAEEWGLANPVFTGQFRVVSCRVASCRVMSCCVVPWRVVPYRAVSCRAVLCR